ncbi:autotransporter assembly complex protein TamA [Roseateles koreensis]|uniref:BamA/TamA family outer membrane protein n=1 Tax=Roseateles koreensis TaxID=2987526 RepID=A0ABT5KW27_9BURK|nr:BamA/TamA family outer membrane protein [Roseateles koreensis]MDC8787149.1 BamA/TamA family outer membrane protein [Roseateles koreensis]
MSLSACSGLAPFSRQAAAPDAKVQAATAPSDSASAPQGVRMVAEYTLNVQAPSELRELLTENLDLARFRNAPADQRLGTQELARLSAAAPQQAQSLLETEGYFNARVTVDRDLTQTPIVVTVKVDPGPRTTIKNVTFSFSGELAPPESGSASLPAPQQAAQQQAEQLRSALQGSWPLKNGAPFVQGAWSNAKTALLGQARAKGYPQARLEQSAVHVDAETNSAEIELQLDSGPLFRLGELHITGLKNQPPEVIERLSGYTPGDPYSEQALLDFQERLVKTTLFDNVNITIRPEPDGPVQTPVWVEVREAPRQQLTTSLGYSSGNGPRVGLDYTNRRPFGLNLRSRFKMNVSQENPSLDWELSSHPRTDMQRDLAALYLERVVEDAKVSINLRARLGRLRETGADDRIYYLEVLRAHETDPQQQINSGAVSANIQWTRRRVDSTLKPTTGYTASLLLGLGRADNTIANSGTFGRSELTLHGYQLLPGGWYGSARTNWSEIFSRDDVGLPEALRYRAGGDESVRGYNLRDLGPVDSDGNATGGRVMWTGSLELAHALTAKLPDLQGAAFVDAGQAAMGWSTLHPTVATGLGLRYRSPLGTLRLDFAHAHATGNWRLHFSVAVAM